MNKTKRSKLKRSVLKKVHLYVSLGAWHTGWFPPLQKLLGRLTWKTEVAWMDASREYFYLRQNTEDENRAQAVVASMMNHPSFGLRTPLDPDGYDVYGNYVGEWKGRAG